MIKPALLPLFFISSCAWAQLCPALSDIEASGAVLGETLVDARNKLYHNEPLPKYSNLIAVGLDTRYSVFVRAWLEFEKNAVEQTLLQATDDSSLQLRYNLLRKITRCIDLE